MFAFIPVQEAIQASCVISLVYGVSLLIYNLYLHPLSHFPGPVWRRAFSLPDRISLLRGYSHHDWKQLHDRYGSVVRVSPSELSFNTAQAWQDIYGRRGRIPLERDPLNHVQEGPPIITGARLVDHKRIRGLISHIVTQSYLRDSEPFLTEHYNQFISRLSDSLHSSASAKVDMKLLFHITTYEIIGDLTLGDSFRTRKMNDYPYLLQKMYDAMVFQSVMRLIATYAVLHKAFTVIAFLLPSLIDTRNEHIEYAAEMAQNRLVQNDAREDLISHIVRQDALNGMTREEIIANTAALLAGGSETTAAALTNVVYRLMSSPKWLKRVQAEVRDAFSSESEINHASVSKAGRFPLMEAVIKEALRMYPSAPGSNARMLGSETEIIDGVEVPPGTTLGVHHWAANRSALNFTDPDDFVPDRWLKDQPERYRKDVLSASQPFTLGASSCVGINLGWLEMRSILVRLFYNFDMELDATSSKWADQRSFLFWEKPPLWTWIRRRGS